ncbi:MAG: AAA family ATPase [Chloroflexota bacterium]
MSRGNPARSPVTPPGPPPLPLRRVALLGGDPGDGHPFSVPAVRSLQRAPLALSVPVTFFVGENGSGKSTLLEGMAIAAGLPAAGASDLPRDPTLAAARRLAGALRLDWSSRSGRGCFLRAEDVFGFARRMDDTRADLERERRAILDDPDLGERARGFALLPYARELHALRERYGDGADARSHGEAFLRLLQQRLAGTGRGLVLLDEPEAPLSPARQLALLALLIDAARAGTQAVIATHSPILMALPGAEILVFGGEGIRPARWEETEHVAITRQFLNDPAGFLRRL